MPRVSVITPTFNCAQFIERALESVFAQTYVDYEVIVIDDGSTDGTEELFASWHPKVNYVRQSNRGLPAARNAAATRASGEFLAYLDADDMWYPDKLEHQIAFLDAHPECGIVHSELNFIDEGDQILIREWYRQSKHKPASGMCVLDLLRALEIQVPTVVERRVAFDRVGGFDERLRRVEDYLHWVQVVLAGHAVGYIDQPLAMYRRRAGSLSSSQAAMVEALIQMFHILVDESAPFERLGSTAREIVSRRVTALQRRLPNCYRWQGRNDLARRRAASLIWDSPLDLYPYLALLKACVPSSVAARLRDLRQTLG